MVMAGLLAMATLPNVAVAAKPGKVATTAKAPVILVLGDSLSAEYGLPRGVGWVALMQTRLQSRPGVQVVNASISGSTTADGLSRLAPLLAQHHPSHVVIELGANDALRGTPAKSTYDNLSQMARMARQSGAKVLLVGMQMPPNFGQRYAQEFAAVFLKVGQAEGARVVPFFLKGVADRSDARDWFQPDGLHPLAKGHPIMLDNVWRELAPML
jgi:acyl-CoA thioesterase-1